MTVSASQSPNTEPLCRITVTGLSHDGRGVGRIQGEVIFIDGALAGEEVLVGHLKKRRKVLTGVAMEILKPSADRVAPACEYFGICGGCSLQHLRPEAQISAKEQILKENLVHLGKVEPEGYLSPITGATWGYRRKARLGSRLVPKKGGILVGFREKCSSYITSLQQCRILDSRFSRQLPALHRLIESLSCSNRIPQIEIAAGDEDAALVFRHLEVLVDEDIMALRAFGKKTGLHIYLQPQGPDSIHCVWPRGASSLAYRLPQFDVTLRFGAADFTQVNADINRRMVVQAVTLLDPRQDEHVLDLFCGLGNFTLPLARCAGKVLGIEADPSLVKAARNNAEHNHISNADFRVADLYDAIAPTPWQGFRFDKLLLDPPRSGAVEVIKQLPAKGPRRIVYVSCNPATLARDANILVNAKGYRFTKAGVLDMFPHTSHVESMAVFEKL